MKENEKKNCGYYQPVLKGTYLADRLRTKTKLRHPGGFPTTNLTQYQKFTILTPGTLTDFLSVVRSQKAAIESTAHAYNRPIVSFEIDIAGLYRALFESADFQPGSGYDRIILDFLIPIDGGCTATAFLKELDIDTVPPHINN